MMIRQRFQSIRNELVEIDDGLYNQICELERRAADPETGRPSPDLAGASAVSNALRAVISILLRVIDSLP